jgi:hypothetical protein
MNPIIKTLAYLLPENSSMTGKISSTARQGG